MPTPNAHALLSASSAHRWLICTMSPTYSLLFPKGTSEYAEEGTLAHAICELIARRKFLGMHGRTYNAQLAKLKETPRFKEEMLTTAADYVQYLYEVFLTFPTPPTVNFEVKVDLSDYVPEGFGTCDNTMIGGDTLHITDYKHGKGVIVSADHNPQMMLYALGALKRYQIIYGDTIKRVHMAIFQPRISSTASECTMTVEELLAWGESIKPTAKAAYEGKGVFIPGPHCVFCPGKEVCRARSKKNTALEDFKDCVTPDKATPPLDEEARKALGLPNILTDEEVGDLLTRGAGLVEWYNDLKDYALQAVLGGKVIPGYKVVEGKSNRAFRDTDKALEKVMAAGYDKAMVYDYKPKTLSELEKLMGKKLFAEVLADEVYKPAGKPTLVEQSDKREALNTAVTDFTGVV